MPLLWKHRVLTTGPPCLNFSLYIYMNCKKTPQKPKDLKIPATIENKQENINNHMHTPHREPI